MKTTVQAQAQDQIQVFQIWSFADRMRFAQPKNLGTFESVQDAEAKLGWYFLNDVCVVLTK